MDHCFLSREFAMAYHAACGHGNVKVSVPERQGAGRWRTRVRFEAGMVDASTPGMLGRLLGGLAAQVEQVVEVAAAEEAGERGSLEARGSSSILSGPGAKLRSSAEWRMRRGSVELSTRVEYESSSYADRLIAGVAAQAAGKRAGEAMELWWKMAREAVARARMASPAERGGVQRALTFDDVPDTPAQGAADSESSWDEEEEAGLTFFDASSVMESPTLRETSEFLQVLSNEARDLAQNVEALEERRNELEQRAMEKHASNPVFRLMRWTDHSIWGAPNEEATTNDAAAVVTQRSTLLLWNSAFGAAATFRKNVWSDVRSRVFLFAGPWLVLALAWWIARRRRWL